MEDINLPHVRQVLLNDLPTGVKPNSKYLKSLGRLFPDVRIHGFGKIYIGSWYLILETKQFPYHILELGSRGYITATSLIQYLPKPEVTK